MGTWSGDQKRATASIVGHLTERGWTLTGYKPDKSDSQTDYYDPACWDGIARRGGVLLLVDVSASHAVHYSTPQPVYGRADGPCSGCRGTGRERQDLPAFTMHVFGGGTEHTPARKAGDPCSACEGRGTRVEYGRTVSENPAIPHLRACPGRWYVVRESDGRVLGTGQRPLKCGDYDEEGKAAAVQLATDIEKAARFEETLRTVCPDCEGRGRDGRGFACRSCNGTARCDRAETEAPGATVRPSTQRAGYVEVIHAAKPGEDIRAELKAAGFRWAVRSRCWYGPADRLPARYGQP